MDERIPSPEEVLPPKVLNLIRQYEGLGMGRRLVYAGMLQLGLAVLMGQCATYGVALSADVISKDPAIIAATEHIDAAVRKLLEPKP